VEYLRDPLGLDSDLQNSIFVIEYDFEAPPAMVSFAKLMLLSKDEWEKVQEKSKPPKPKLEGSLVDILISTTRTRLAEYPRTLQVN
jgi:SET domain-containing protein 6